MIRAAGSEWSLDELDNSGDRLCQRLLHFTRFIRANGFLVGLHETQDSLYALSRLASPQRQQLRLLLRSIFCSNSDDWQRFEALFDAFWKPPNHSKSGSTDSGAASKKLQRSAQERGLSSDTSAAADSDLDANANDKPGALVAEGGAFRGGASAQDSPGRSDFRLLSDRQQLRQMELLAERLARRLQRRLTRRHRLGRRGRQLHLRHTIRASMRYGGTPLQLVLRRQRQRSPRLLLLLDVSRSMSLYSYLFLRFMRGMIGSFSDCDAFMYHTRLVHITSALRERNIEQVKQKLALMSGGWSGGTRIGASLAEFNHRYGRRLVNSRTLVIIVSDGLDTGAPEQLADELRQIRRRARRIVWLNPLLGRAGYQPIQAGMQAALPFIDLFAPAHNLDSLLALESQLLKL